MFPFLFQIQCVIQKHGCLCPMCPVLWPEWPHRLRWLPRMLKLQDQFPVELRLHRFMLCTRRSGSTAHEGGGATCLYQFDLPSLTPLSVASCGRLQLGVPHWAAIDLTFCGSRFSTGRLLAIEDFTFLLYV